MNMIRKRGYLIVAVVVSAASMVTPAAYGQRAPITRRVSADSLVTAVQRRIGAPSISVAAMVRGELVYSRAFGLADAENNVPATPSTVYRIASVSKPITAAAVLRLVSEQKLSLDTSIRRYVSGLPATYEAVTLRDLLRHTSGVRHYKDNNEFVTTRHCDSLAQSLAIFAQDSLEHAPGDAITYSSWGFVLLGLAVEHAARMPYTQYVQRAIFDSAGMSSIRLDNLGLIPHRARGYQHVRRSTAILNSPPVDLSCRIPAGGFVSTPLDLVRFASALVDGRIVDRQLANSMMRSQVTEKIIRNTLIRLKAPPDFKPPGMGFGWGIEPDGSAAYHGGNQPGFTSMLYHVPAGGVSVAVMVNIDGAGDELTTLARELARQMTQLK